MCGRFLLLNEIKELINNDEPIKIELFTHNLDPEISQVSVNLCSSKYELSPIWEKRGSPILKEEKRLQEILEDVFIKYKLKIAKEFETNVKNKIKLLTESKNDEELQSTLEDFKKIKGILKDLSNMQGRVIL